MYCSLPVVAPSAFLRVRAGGALCRRPTRGRSARCARSHRIARLEARRSSQAEHVGGSRCAARGTTSPSCRSTTAGDRDRSSPFGQIGERGVFVKEIEEALLAGRIDVAVHSAKDIARRD